MVDIASKTLLKSLQEFVDSFLFSNEIVVIDYRHLPYIISKWIITARQKSIPSSYEGPSEGYGD